MASVVQPARHFSSWVSQIGVVPLQSAFVTHCAHFPVAKHVGAEAGQSVLTAHCTH